ncbi:flippase [Salinisphaera orenii]|uniref:flippase n=1 Tax=Salinisphaera orenii TaxID=856731 RepID=UPI001C82B676|nr:flippase [Salinisphaera halophila]
MRGGIGSLAIKSANAILGFAVAVVLARVLGPEGYGVYSFALALLMVTAIPAQVGVPQLVVRETATAQADEDWGLMRGLWRWGNAAVAILSVLALLAVSGVVLLTDIGGDGPRAATLTVGLAVIPLLALAKVRGASLRGLRKVVQGQLPESVIRPAVLLALVGAWAALAGPGNTMRPERAMALYAVASILAFGIGAWLLRRFRPSVLSTAPRPVYQHRAWAKAVIPLALITGLQLINNYADLIVLGIFRADEEVGVYRAVFQMTLLVVFGLQAMNQVLQPHFARLYQRGDYHRLQRLVTLSARVILALALPPVLLFLIAGEVLLAWVFGDAFRTGAVTLGVLAVGQLFNSAMGSVGMLLNMTGHERDTMRGIAWAAAANVVMNFALIPIFGMEGAAAASVLTLIWWNILLRRAVIKRLGLETLATGPLPWSDL